MSDNQSTSMQGEISGPSQPRYHEMISLGLPKEFVALCQRDHVAPATVLHGFIADLCAIRNSSQSPRADQLSSNGSDERTLAREYYRRVGYRDLVSLKK